MRERNYQFMDRIGVFDVKEEAVFFSGFNGFKRKKHKQHMDVSKNRGTPKWMVYNGKPD